MSIPLVKLDFLSPSNITPSFLCPYNASCYGFYWNVLFPLQTEVLPIKVLPIKSCSRIVSDCLNFLSNYYSILSIMVLWWEWWARPNPSPDSKTGKKDDSASVQKKGCFLFRWFPNRQSSSYRHTHRIRRQVSGCSSPVSPSSFMKSCQQLIGQLSSMGLRNLPDLRRPERQLQCLALGQRRDHISTSRSVYYHIKNFLLRHTYIALSLSDQDLHTHNLTTYFF